MYRRLMLAVLILGSVQTLAQKKKAVFIIADGIPADVIEKLDLPNIRALSKDGTYLHIHVGGDRGSYNETPTISAVGYNSLLTGTWVNKHNVVDNDIKEPNYNYPTIFRLFKEQYPDKKVAVFSTWLDNRTKLLGHNLRATGNQQVDYHFDGYELDTVRFKHDGEKEYIRLIDEQVTNAAVSTIRENAPDLSWVYLEATDDKGHKYGDGPEFYKAVAQLDDQVRRIYEAVNYRKQKFNEDWLLILTTDHGRTELNGKGHGGQTDRERNTWMVTNSKDLNSYAAFYDPSIVDIMPTLARFTGLKINKDLLKEIDGTALTGAVSVAELNVNYIQGNIHISWKALEKAGNVKILISATNNYKTGGKDKYVLLADVPVSEQHVLVDVKKYPSSFYKIVAEAPNNTVNKWLFVPVQAVR